MGRRRDDLSGVRFGSLVAVECLGSRGSRAGMVWRCDCDCGSEREVLALNLKSGNTKSCGCSKVVHGHGAGGGSRTYKSYEAMISRCSENGKYFDRGIRVCDRWVGDGGFVNFLSDMGDRPDGCSIDRIDNDGDYSAENCRWATPSEQMRNTSYNKWVVLSGKRMTCAEALRSLGLPPSTIVGYRRRFGLDPQEALDLLLVHLEDGTYRSRSG